MKLNGLELAVEQFNAWQGNAVVFLDIVDNSVWCDVQDIPTYHSEQVIPLVSKDDLYGRTDTYSVTGVQSVAIAAKNKIAEGYEPWQFDYVLADVIQEALI